MLLSLSSLVLPLALTLCAVGTPAHAVVYPHDIQGAGYLSPLAGQTVRTVQGIITAKTSTGCYLQTPTSEWDRDDATSEAIFLFGSSTCKALAVNDWIEIGSAAVSEYRQFQSNLRTTELTSAANVTVIRSNASRQLRNTIIGRDRSPPHMYIGTLNPFALPANTTNLETGSRSARLDVKTYSADFWESLESMLVTLPSPTVLGPLTTFNETYLLASGLPSPSRNARGGLTLAAYDTKDDNKRWDANGQAILISDPLDGSTLPADLVLGDVLQDVRGIVSYDFGVYTFLPLTAPRIQRKVKGGAQRSPFRSTGRCTGLIAGTFNLENLASTDAERITRIGEQISDYLRSPDVLVLNEVQDNDGANDDGVVTANQTLAMVVEAIQGAQYAFTDIDPVNDRDGGEPGGNIRPAIIYRTDRMKLTAGIPTGDSTQSVGVTKSGNGNAQLTLNPGRIDPSNAAWQDSRKPIAAQFELANGGLLFVVGAHLTSKGGSTTPYGPPQAPVNAGVQQRIMQATVIRNFVADLLRVQKDAKVLVMGDFNEFSQVQPIDALVGGSEQVLDEVRVGPRVERYTYIFQQNSQQIDHIFASPAIARRPAVAFIPHVNTWTTVADATSDHDPILASLSVCA